jgi:oxygen-dependent protoporphyrinogen oxidase
MHPRIAIVGAGISGLAAATAAVEAARAAGLPLEAVVFERSEAVGGKARSLRRDHWLLEAGPAAFVDDADTGPVLNRLVDLAQLTPEVVYASTSAQHRFLVHGGRMREVHANPIRFAASGLLSPIGLMRLLAEPLVPRRRSRDDESVWDFAARRIGRQAADRLVAPMVLGIFAGDAHRLSLEAAFPRLAVLEREHGSLVRGMLANRGKRRGGPAGPSGRLGSFREGLQALPIALARRRAFTVRCDSETVGLTRRSDGRWAVHVRGDGDAFVADAVVLACEAQTSARLLESLCPRAVAPLQAIPYPPAVVVSLGYEREAAYRVPDGFGVLVPRGERVRMLGCVWDSRLFAGRSPADAVLVRAILGGATDPDALTMDDEDAVGSVCYDLRRLLGITAPPVLRHVVRWPNAIPQYELGHARRVTEIEAAVAELPGLFLAGNVLHGIAFGKAAATGWTAGERAAGAVLGREARAKRSA